MIPSYTIAFSKDFSYQNDKIILNRIDCMSFDMKSKFGGIECV